MTVKQERQTGLGRGLAALIPQRTTGPGSIEIPIDRVEGKFKLNQGEKPERTSAAIAKLEEQGAEALASAMRRYNDL